MSKNCWTRRDVVLGLGVGAGAMAAGFPRSSVASDKYDKTSGVEERYDAFYRETDVRPEFGWMNREDVIYHDMDMPPEIAALPEYSAFFNDPVWVFNRSTQWVRSSGTILCYEKGASLMLTGADQVSSWHTGEKNTLSNEGQFTNFAKKSLRRRDAATLPALQFRLNQHPVLEVEVAEANTDWQLCITPKGRSGPPLISTAWRSGLAKLQIDVAAELKIRNLDWAYPELHFGFVTWNSNPAHVARVKCRMSFATHAAVATCLPVIRTIESARNGVPITAIVVDANGEPLGKDAVRVTALINGEDFPLTETDGIWQTALRGLTTGDHQAHVRSEGSVIGTTACDVRVTDGQFLSFKRGASWVKRDGKPLGPLTGTYMGTVFIRNAGKSDERLVQGQKEWDAWDRSAQDSEHMHFWESLSEAELDQRLRHLGESGFSFTALHSHWGDWERLDAGGRIAPHGAEQLARYIRIASRHGMSHIQAIASGPYATQKVAYGGTIPYSRYLEMGFTTEQFMLPGAAFDEYYHQYLTDLALLLRDETGLFGYTAAGEGDHFVGPARTNDTMHTVQSIDQNHAFLAETVNMMTKLPQTLNRGFDEDRFGARTYFIGNHYLPEADIGVLFKLLHMSDMYLAEGSWPPMPSYVRFHYDVLRDGNGSSKCWTGTEHFRRRLRDTLYLGLVNLLPVINAWDEAFTEDEHIIFREICALIDWHQSFAIPKLTIAVTDLSADLEDPAYGSLIQHEIALSRLGIAYRFVQRGERTTGSPYLLDGTALPEVLRYRSEGGVIPDELSKTVPLLVSPGYGTNHVVSVDGLTTLAYIYNTTRHDRQYYWLGGHNHRAPIPAPLSVSVDLHMERTLRLRLYDLGTRRLIMDKAFHRSETLHLGETDSDFFCVVTPT